MQPSPAPDVDMQSAVAPPASLVKGVERFGHFVINRRDDGEFDILGAGAMGITYRAFDAQLERSVALKVIHPQLVHNPDIRSRFAREAKAAARLQHPNIASVLFQGEDEGVCFYAMELVVGEDLHRYVSRVGALSPVHALQMAQQIALALVSAAKEGILHRDLKPSNVMLTSYHEGGAPHLKVIDFGLAKLTSDLPGTFTTGGFLGTPEFASPEQCDEQPLDARSDLYSLGSTLWFMLTARTLFSGSMLAVMKAHVSAPLPLEVLSEAPEPLLTVLRRLLAKDRNDRPSSALDAVREIEHASRLLEASRKNFLPLEIKEQSAAGAPMRPRVKKQRKVLLAVSAVAVCSTVLAGGLILWRKGERGEARAGQNLPSVNEPSGNTAEGGITNSLGMRFVRIPGTDVLFSVWETRVRDFTAFNQATGYAAESAGSANMPGWSAPGFAQDGNHPVVNVTVEDAKRFCEWLTDSERKAGRITAAQEYRLPCRPEWDSAVGVQLRPKGRREFGGPPPRPRGPNFEGPGNSGQTRPYGPRPDELSPEDEGEEFDIGDGPKRRPPPPFHWSNHAWPPPATFGNYADESARRSGSVREIIDQWNDGFAFSAPVGRFSPNPYGIFDISGNVSEMCYDGPPGSPIFGKLGGSWATAKQDELRVHQITPLPITERSTQVGFRCVLATTH